MVWQPAMNDSAHGENDGVVVPTIARQVIPIIEDAIRTGVSVLETTFH